MGIMMMVSDQTGHDSRPPEGVVIGWNVLATAKNHEQSHLIRRLKRFGNFRWSPYHGVLLGRVEDCQTFLEQLHRREESESGFLYPLARLVTVGRTFPFTVDTLVPLIKAEVQGYLDRMEFGSFYVRVERRGHKDEVRSREIEEEVADEIFQSLAQRGCAARVDFQDPDVIVAIEIVGDECGIGLITKSLRERYPFLKVP